MSTELIRSGFVVIALVFLCFISLREKQNIKLNWSIFYSCLFTAVSLPIVNILCTHYGLWEFTNGDTNSSVIPLDIFFVWIVAWGIIPIFFLEKRYFPIILFAVFWMDFILMPVLEEYEILRLNSNWLIGEFILIAFVFVPAYIWAYISYHNIYLEIRAVLQILVMIGLFIIGLPYALFSYGLLEQLNFRWSTFDFQLLLIIIFPALVAVQDLVSTGRGTPFPYDKTKYLVTNGIYAYCRNPIQWSFTFMFVSLAIYHSSYYFLIGLVVSFAYSIGIADIQEYPDMKSRFGEKWTTYIKQTPRWYFQWKPIGMPQGTIYFDTYCGQCNAIANWFKSKSTHSLSIEAAKTLEGSSLLKATYIDDQGNKHESTKAIARALEHINLGYAVLGWFIRFVGINFILQAIVDSMDFQTTNTSGKQ